MKQFNKIILSSLILSSLCFANEQNTLVKELEGTNTYVGMQFGSSHLNVKKDSGSLILNEALDEEGSSINFELGLSYSRHIDLSLNYRRINNDDVGLDNFYLSSKYRFNTKEVFSPYLGVNLGYSQLSWDKNPINTSGSNDFESGSFMLGALAGILYPINKNLSLDMNYQADYMKHKTYLQSNTNKATLTHNLLQTLNFGFRYSF